MEDLYDLSESIAAIQFTPQFLSSFKKFNNADMQASSSAFCLLILPIITPLLLEFSTFIALFPRAHHVIESRLAISDGVEDQWNTQESKPILLITPVEYQPLQCAQKLSKTTLTNRTRFLLLELTRDSLLWNRNRRCAHFQQLSLEVEYPFATSI